MIEPSAITGAWAVFTTIRYAIAVTIYVPHDRKTILLVLTSVSAFTVTLVITSIILSIFSRTLGWDISLRSTYVTIQSLLGFSTSLSLLGPAITNFVLVFLWRNASDAANSLRGRCSWDIDVAWSGTGGQCNADHVKGWGFWLGGALFRLILTFIAVVCCSFTIFISAEADIIDRWPITFYHTNIALQGNLLVASTAAPISTLCPTLLSLQQAPRLCTQIGVSKSWCQPITCQSP